MARVLSVGQCGYDHGSISRELRQAFGVEVVAASGLDDAVAAARRGGFDLVLVNRVLDADGSPGTEVIRAFRADPGLKDVPVMMVSNYPDAQREAESLGALPGFGKAELNMPRTRERLQAVLSPGARG